MARNLKSWGCNVRVVACEPISHCGETAGISTQFNRIKVISGIGEVEDVPVVSGNSIRGQFRDLLAAHLLTTLGIEQCSKPAFRLLFSGGVLAKQSAKAPADLALQLREMLPHVALLGASVGNRMLASCLTVGMFIPIAHETTDYLPKALREFVHASVYDLLQEESYTRREDAKDTRYNHFLAADERDPDGDAEQPEVNASQQLRYHVETLSTGTNFYWHFFLRNASELVEGAFITALRLFAAYPALGGKLATGHGLVEMLFENGWKISPWAFSLPEAQHYEEYLRDNAREIKLLLDSIP